jgi:hypothetical protein
MVTLEDDGLDRRPALLCGSIRRQSFVIVSPATIADVLCPNRTP